MISYRLRLYHPSTKKGTEGKAKRNKEKAVVLLQFIDYKKIGPCLAYMNPLP